MKDIIHQISLIPGIAGVLAYASDGAMLAQDFPAVYDEGMLQKIVNTLASDTIIMQGLGNHAGTLDLKFAKGRVIIKTFKGGTLFALCTASVNIQLLGLALTQATRRLEMGLEALREGKGRAAAPAPAVRTAPSGPVLPQAASIIEGVKRSLIRQMGPLGTMVFDSVYADWAAESAPNRKGLEGLLIQLAREFDEPAKQEAFLNDARTILG